MKRIENSKDAYPFINKIVAFKPKSSYYSKNLATLNETKQLKELVENDKITLGFYNKSNALHVLNNYTPTENSSVESRNAETWAFYIYDQKSGELEKYNYSEENMKMLGVNLDNS